MFFYVLKSYDWMRLAGIDEVGIVKLVDGSLFPTLTSMCWATYKKSKNALRLHLEMDLNTMIPTEFLVQKANSSERSFLLLLENLLRFLGTCLRLYTPLHRSITFTFAAFL